MIFQRIKILVTFSAALPVSFSDQEPVFNYRATLDTAHFLGKLFRTLRKVIKIPELNDQRPRGCESSVIRSASRSRSTRPFSRPIRPKESTFVSPTKSGKYLKMNQLNIILFAIQIFLIEIYFIVDSRLKGESGNSKKELFDDLKVTSRGKSYVCFTCTRYKKKPINQNKTRSRSTSRNRRKMTKKQNCNGNTEGKDVILWGDSARVLLDMTSTYLGQFLNKVSIQLPLMTVTRVIGDDFLKTVGVNIGFNLQKT